MTIIDFQLLVLYFYILVDSEYYAELDGLSTVVFQAIFAVFLRLLDGLFY